MCIRDSVVAVHFGENLLFAFGVVQTHVGTGLETADDQRMARALVQQRDELPVDLVDLGTMLLDLRDNAVFFRHRLSFHDSSDNEFGPGGCRQPPCGAAHPHTKAAGVPADTTACPQAPPMHAGGGRRAARVPDMIANAARCV